REMFIRHRKYITLRPSCYECKWARPERCADITLGDFWGIENYNSELNAKEGISQVIINTPKGGALFDALILGSSIWHQCFPIEVAIRNNGCLAAPTKLTPERSAFFRALQTYPFEKVVDLYLKSKRQWIFDIYYGMPGNLRRFVRKLMDKRMRYE
ncbi:MAG: Coenzyme F420 hydrogenase/dehydrogenase, beta subunit C-terminal domain, partial [Prevotella sp.]|nr:Coenzyme F420 hydrogenase/dehydrogenase, beta subunit C-terminal domain [Prevotella sp.]